MYILIVVGISYLLGSYFWFKTQKKSFVFYFMPNLLCSLYMIGYGILVYRNDYLKNSLLALITPMIAIGLIFLLIEKVKKNN